MTEQPWWKQMTDAFVHLAYPPLCLHCRSGVADPSVLFCQPCAELLQLIEPRERCLYCFGDQLRPDTGICLECSKRAPVLHRVGACFDYLGPAGSLVKQLKYGHKPHLAAGGAAFLLAQWAHLDWPVPDVIIPVPMPTLRRLSRGYNQSQLLAEELGKMLNRPVVNILNRTSGDFSQAGLSIAQRQKLSGDTVRVKAGGPSLADQELLLIDDVLTSGATLRRCAEALSAAGPATIYGLTLCRATK